MHVPSETTRYEKTTVNGHEFEVFLSRNRGQGEWYCCLLGPLPEHLEEEHERPGLLGRGETEAEARARGLRFLEKTFPAWPEEKWEAWKKKVAEAEEAARKAEEAKKAARKKAAEAKKKKASAKE